MSLEIDELSNVYKFIFFESLRFPLIRKSYSDEFIILNDGSLFVINLYLNAFLVKSKLLFDESLIGITPTF